MEQIHIVNSISDLPRTPAVYGLFGGESRSQYVAYVGVASDLHRRIEQHLVRRNSSVTTGVSAVMLNPDHVTEVWWWEHPSFTKRAQLEAAELVAFDVLDPSLRSRSSPRRTSIVFVEDDDFAADMRSLFSGEPTGRLAIQTLQTALDRIAELEHRMIRLEQQLGQDAT